eukprot:Skav226929  [mRNA]  locus=scaffold3020:72657:73124:+ [translate_table: standard]
MTLLNSILCELGGFEEGDDDFRSVVTRPAEAASVPFTTAEVPVTKVQGVRAAKSCTWLARAETITETLVSIVSTSPMVRLSAWFLKTQRKKGWLSKEACERPLVNLVSPQHSPAVRAVSECVHILKSGLTGPLGLFDGVLDGTGSLRDRVVVKMA